jgi:tetratricopeptide (TPR) repeat protein
VRRSLFAAFLLALCAAGAEAASYDDFAQGLAADQHGDSVLAVTFFTSALAAGDLSAGLLPQAYRGRGLAYLRLRRCDLALADFDAALKLKPDYGDALALRAGAHACRKDFTAALADFSALIDKAPVAESYAGRGRLRWETGDFADAADDFAQQLRLAPSNGYAFLWLESARQHAGTFDAKRAARDADAISTRHWPGALVSFYVGDETVDEVDREAARPDVAAADAQVCEADFFVGEWLLGHADAAGARTRLQRAADACPRGESERYNATTELERLK